MNKKAMELSINMIVVIILGLAMLGVGFSIFYKTYNKTIDVKERVDTQTQEQLNRLLDTGEAVVIPFNSKEASRGDYVDFDIGLSNELGRDANFFIFVYYAGTTAVGNVVPSLQPHSSTITSPCLGLSEPDSQTCGDLWVLTLGRKKIESSMNSYQDINKERYGSHYFLQANKRISIPLRIVLPRKLNSGGLPDGQYVFNVDIYRNGQSTNTDTCDMYESSLNTPADCTSYFSRKKIYVTVN